MRLFCVLRLILRFVVDNMVAEQFERFNWHAFSHFGVPATQIGAELASKIIQTFLKHSCLQETINRHGHMFKSDGHKKLMQLYCLTDVTFENGTHYENSKHP